MAVEANIAQTDEIMAQLEEADFVPALLALTQLTGDLGLLRKASPHIHGGWSFQEQVPADIKAETRQALARLVREGLPEKAAVPDDDFLMEMMTLGAGQPVPARYLPLLVEELRLGDADMRGIQWRNGQPPENLAGFKAIVIGAGLAGICTAVRLKEMGIPFEIIEKNDGIGGTWYENRYPGVGVDTPNHLYSYSFQPYAKWTHHFSKGEQVLEYIKEVFDEYDLRPHVRFDTEVTSLAYDEDAACWTVATLSGGEAGHETANVVITAVGQLNRPFIPELPGHASFKGPQYHTAQWDPSVDLAGKRVAIIGAGASAMQVGPAIAPQVGKLVMFQRSPHWININPNYHKVVTDGQRWALENVPHFSEWMRFLLFWATADCFYDILVKDPTWQDGSQSINQANAKFGETLLAHLHRELEGRDDLIAKCTPNYPPYGKRMLRDNHWFKMLRQPHVELVDTTIDHITPSGIVTSDGQAHEVDVILYATGFHASRILWPMDIVGRDGFTIRDAWGEDDPRAYLGMTIPHFPNFFMTFGPNTALAHGGSAIFFNECQVHYITHALRDMIEKDYRSFEVRPDVHDDFNETVDQMCNNMVWSHAGVNNWYKNARNRVTSASPWKLIDYWNMTREFDTENYIIEKSD